MPLQNRVDPFSRLIATPERGAWYGNRGCLHNDQGQMVRPFQLKRWIVCVLQFKGRRRPLLQPGRFTELFFMDEATAFAAGHRPCMECRREAAVQFLALAGERRATELDERLHGERWAPRPEVEDWRTLPDGAMVASGEAAFLVQDGTLLMWTPAGYVASEPPESGLVLLTPPTTVQVIRLGYPVQIDPTISG